MAENGSTLPTSTKSPAAEEHVSEGKGKGKAVSDEPPKNEPVEDEDDEEDDDEEDANEGDEGYYPPPAFALGSRLGLLTVCSRRRGGRHGGD